MNFHLISGNYVDLLIILVLFYFATEAFRHGFWVILSDFIAFLGSLVLSLRFYKFFSTFLQNNFALSGSISNALGFLISAVFIETFLGFIFGHLIYRLPKVWKRHKLNKLVGIIPGIGEGIVLVSFLLTLIVALPLKPNVKNDVTNSQIGSFLLEKTVGVENAINQVFGGVIEESLTYLTIHPTSTDSVSLEDVESIDLSVDENSESELYARVNEERDKLAIPKLVWDSQLAPVARDHATDMWQRRYFSHYSPEGEDVGDRLKESGVFFGFAGENLALAPTISTAHTGLMNSQGHRENILNPKFKKIGIGVIDNGIYGKMFVQIFTD